MKGEVKLGVEGLIHHYFNLKVMANILPFLWRGALLTIEFAVLGQVFGLVLGLLIAQMRMSSIRIFQWIASVYIEALRGTPLLMQIIFIYYALPYIGLQLPPFFAALVSLSLNSAAYCAEILRGGIQSIERGQTEAAYSIGMNSLQSFFYIILPQALRRVLPPLTNSFVALIKDTSLISVIAVPELLRTAREAMVWQINPSAFTIAAILYLCMTLPMARLSAKLEERWK